MSISREEVNRFMVEGDEQNHLREIQSPSYNGNGQVEEGGRNIALFDSARRLRGLGIVGEELNSYIHAINRGVMSTPLPASEVGSIISSVERYYHNREDTTTRSITSYLMEDNRYITVYEQGIDVTYRYQEGVWHKVVPISIRQQVRNEYDLKSTPHKCNDVYKDLQNDSYRDDVPWGRVEQEWIPCKDYIRDCRNDCNIEHSPEYYLKIKLAINPDFDMATPTWDKFMVDCFGDDDEKRLLLLEYAGYSLTHKASLKKGLVCLGEPNTGKSLFGDMLTEIIGSEFVSNTKIHTINKEFGKAKLVDMLLNIDDEPVAKFGLDETTLKTVIGTNPRVEVNAKNKQQVSVKLRAKFLILANRLPSVEDSSGGFFVRLLILRFDNPIPKELIDTELINKLRPEYPGIVAKAIRAYSDLVKRNYIFTESQSSREALLEYRLDNDPVYQFLKHYLIKDDKAVGIITNEALYQNYEEARRNKSVPDVVELPKLDQKGFTARLNMIEGYEIKPHYQEGGSQRGLKGYSFRPRAKTDWS